MPEITIQHLAQVLDVSLSTIEKTMRELRNEKIITRKGSRKSGKWFLEKSETDSEL